MRSDIEFNISFCKLIENYPSIYDSQRPDYAHKESQDNLWESIAKQAKESANDCRERWKNIRNRYLKYVNLKSIPNPTKRVKEYYLAPYLSFLEKHLKPRKPRASRVSRADDDSVTEDEPENPLASSPSHSQPPNNIDTVFIPSSSSRVAIKRESPSKNGNEPSFDLCFSKRLKTNKEERSEETFDTVNEYYTSTADTMDTDMAFLKSVLPDMQAMNLAQKRRFKIGIMKLAEQILEEDF